MTAPTIKLTNGDLDGMDAGELREHLAAYVDRHGMDAYADVVIERTARLADLHPNDILAALDEDLIGRAPNTDDVHPMVPGFAR